jgi:zinc protease
VEDSPVPELGIRQMTLSNGARVNMKQTDFEAGVIRFTARFGNGQLGQPKNATSLTDFSNHMLSFGGLANHTQAEIENALIGTTIEYHFWIGEGYFSLDGSSNMEDLKLALQAVTAHFVDAAYRDEAVGLWQERIPAYLESFEHSLWATFNYDLLPFLLGGDGRFTAPTEEQLYAFTAKDARDWLSPYLESSYLEFSIIGDFNEDATIGIILDTIGALPQRADAPAEIANERRFIEVPTAPQSKSVTYESKIPQAGAYMVWEAPSLVDRNIDVARRFDVLSEVFSDRIRVKIREAMGGATDTGDE